MICTGLHFGRTKVFKKYFVGTDLKMKIRVTNLDHVIRQYKK